MVLICAVELATSGRPRGLNAQQGVVLGTNAVLQRLELRRVRVVEGILPVPRGIGAEGKPRMWGLRWRRRWASRHTKIRVRGYFPTGDMREKVREESLTLGETSPPR